MHLAIYYYGVFGSKAPASLILGAYEKRITELEKENLLLQEKATFLTRKLYGRSTEQTSSLGIEGQMSLFDEAESSADSFAVEPDLKDAASYRRRKFKGQREELLKDIPHEKNSVLLLRKTASVRNAEHLWFLSVKNSYVQK